MIVAVKEPATVGAKTTSNVAELPAAIGPAGKPLIENGPPLAVGDESVKAAVPEF
jgi:hypothetical protein